MAVVNAAGHAVVQMNQAGVVSACVVDEVGEVRRLTGQLMGQLIDHMVGYLGHRGERVVKGGISACAIGGVRRTIGQLTGQLIDHMVGYLGHLGERNVKGVVNLLIARVVMTVGLHVTMVGDGTR